MEPNVPVCATAVYVKECIKFFQKYRFDVVLVFDGPGSPAKQGILDNHYAALPAHQEALNCPINLILLIEWRL
jgi:hypothetical protein